MSEEQGSVLAGNPEVEDTGVATEPVTEAAAESTLTEAGWASQEYSGVVEAKGWKSADDVLKSYVNLEKQIGSDKVTLPTAEEDITEWDGWSQLGTPEEASGYQLDVPSGYEGYSEELSDWFRQEAHAARLPAAMAQRLHDKFVERAISQETDFATEQQHTMNQWDSELKKEYGAAYDERIGLARRAVRAFGSDELSDVLNQTGMGNHPEMIRAFARIGAELSSGQQFKDSEQTGQFGVTPDMAKEQIAQIRANPALYDKSHAEHKLLNEKLTQLNEVAYGNEVLFSTGSAT